MAIQVVWADELCDVLQAELTHYRRINEVLACKQRLLIGNQIEALLEVDAQLRQLRQGLLQLESRRLQTLRSSQIPATLKLGELLTCYQGELTFRQSHTLREIHGALQGVLVSFRELHLGCERLVQGSLDWVQETIELISQTDGPCRVNSYNGQGQALKHYSSDPRPIATDHRA